MIRIHEFYVLRALVAGAGLMLLIGQMAGRRDLLEIALMAAVVGVLAFQLHALAQRLEAAADRQAQGLAAGFALLWSAAMRWTIWLDAGEQGTWREAMGWIMLAGALVLTGVVFLRERAAMRELGEGD